METSQMTAFQQLVEERTDANPQSFFARGSQPGRTNPFKTPGQPPSEMARPKTAPANQASSIQPATPPQNPGADRPQSGQAYARPSGKGDRPLNPKYEAERAATRAMMEKVDGIQLREVMHVLGGQPNQDNDKSKWKIAGVGNITITGQKFYNLESEEGGHGAVNLVKHVKQLKFHEAVKWLANAFGTLVDSDEIKAAQESGTKVKRAFSPPPKSDKHIGYVKHYLKFTRKIPEDLIDMLVKQGRVYADEDKTCVFASDGIAELRSSFDGEGSIKKLVPGSVRKKGFLVLPDKAANEKTLAICESAIDAMSYRALHPGRAAISSAGANRGFPRSLAEDAIENGYKVHAAFDADKAGDKASQALFNHFYLKLWLKHKGQAELGQEFDDETLFTLLDSNTVKFKLITRPSEKEEEDYDPAAGAPTPAAPTDHEEIHEKRNILFFNKADPFEDPADPPTILVTIGRNEFGLPQCTDFPIEVSPKGYQFIVEKVGVVRDRPRGEKDWNEMLKKSTLRQPAIDSRAVAQP